MTERNDLMVKEPDGIPPRRGSWSSAGHHDVDRGPDRDRQAAEIVKTYSRRGGRGARQSGLAD